MAVAKRLPWYVSLAYLLGLVGILCGQRIFAHTDGASTFFTVVGAVLLFAATGARALGFARAKGDIRRIERLQLMTYIGGIVAMGVFAFTTRWGIGVLGYVDADPAELDRLVIPLHVTWSIILLCSLIPLIATEIGQVGTRSRQRDSEASFVDGFRIGEMASSGLTISLFPFCCI